MKKRLISALVAGLAVLVALIAVNSNANAAIGPLYTGQTVVSGTNSARVTWTSADRHTAGVTTPTGTKFCLVDRSSATNSLTQTWTIVGKIVRLYRTGYGCPSTYGGKGF